MLFFSFQAPTHPQEVILIVNRREELSKNQQTTGSIDENNKPSTTTISPKPTRQRERSAVETDDDELLAQLEKFKLESNGPTANDDEFIREKIIETRLLARRKENLNGTMKRFSFNFFIRNFSEKNLRRFS